jgi:hypothetical protein
LLRKHQRVIKSENDSDADQRPPDDDFIGADQCSSDDDFIDYVEPTQSVTAPIATPVTAAPVTATPVTAAPVTAAPIAAQVTAAPVTDAQAVAQAVAPVAAPESRRTRYKPYKEFCPQWWFDAMCKRFGALEKPEPFEAFFSKQLNVFLTSKRCQKKGVPNGFSTPPKVAAAVEQPVTVAVEQPVTVAVEQSVAVEQPVTVAVEQSVAVEQPVADEQPVSPTDDQKLAAFGSHLITRIPRCISNTKIHDSDRCKRRGEALIRKQQQKAKRVDESSQLADPDSDE